jgi:hypothetical protein
MQNDDDRNVARGSDHGSSLVGRRVEKWFTMPTVGRRQQLYVDQHVTSCDDAVHQYDEVSHERIVSMCVSIKAADVLLRVVYKRPMTLCCVPIGEGASQPFPKTSIQHRYIIISAADVLWTAMPGTGQGTLH